LVISVYSLKQKKDGASLKIRTLDKTNRENGQQTAIQPENEATAKECEKECVQVQKELSFLLRYFKS